jgi:hypothetical protein
VKFVAKLGRFLFSTSLIPKIYKLFIPEVGFWDFHEIQSLTSKTINNEKTYLFFSGAGVHLRNKKFYGHETHTHT